MKKYLIILLLLIALPCEARMGAVMMGAGVSAATGCTTGNDSELVAIGGNSSGSFNLYSYYAAQPITVTAGSKVTEIVPYLRNTTAGAVTTTCGIFNRSGGIPTTQVDGATGTTDYATNAWAYVPITFAATVTLPGTDYYVKCHASADVSMLIGYNNTATGSNACIDTNDVDWSCAQNVTIGIKVNGCAP